ncbi:hypothetical protein ACQEU5_20925 [Marinactinospora thermotolerans]|uniref:hypothetical protein n=1 Tax=Marinactinospora thermotolerans TaxID=531310 RepID=UPI003D8F9CF3
MKRTLLCALPIVVMLSACGGGTTAEEESSDPTPEEAAASSTPTAAEEEGAAEARAVAEDFLAAVRDGDGEVGCAIIEEAAHASVTLTTMSSGTLETECVPAFPTYAEGFTGADVAEIESVEMGTDTSGETPIATVNLAYPEGTEGELAEDLLLWLMDDGQWRIRTVPFAGLTS